MIDPKIVEDPESVRAVVFCGDESAATAWLKANGMERAALEKQDDPFAICTASLGEQHTAAWEKCVQNLKDKFGKRDGAAAVEKGILFDLRNSHLFVPGSYRTDVEDGVILVRGRLTKSLGESEADWEFSRDTFLPEDERDFVVQKRVVDGQPDGVTFRFGAEVMSVPAFFAVHVPEARGRSVDSTVVFKGFGPAAHWMQKAVIQLPGGASLEPVDDGRWKVGRKAAGSVELILAGKIFKGSYLLERDGRGGWALRGPASIGYEIVKGLSRLGVRKDEDQRFTLGVAYPANKRDAHGDRMKPDELESSAWAYLAKEGGRQIGFMHEDGTDGTGTLVESFIWRFGPREIEGQKVGDGDWLIGVVWDEPTWKSIRAGKVTGYSIQGTAFKA